MRKLYIILFLIHFGGHSQNISLDEIISIKNQKLTVAKNILIEKGWFVFSELEPTKTKSGVFAFAVKSEWENKHQDFSTYESFIEYHFSSNSLPFKINYNTGSKKAYEAILKRLSELHFKTISSKKNEMLYSNSECDVKIEIINNRVVKNYYMITLSDKKLSAKKKK